MKTSTVRFYIKDPDEWGRLIGELDLDTRMEDKFFEYSEYATVELTFDESLNVVGKAVARMITVITPLHAPGNPYIRETYESLKAQTVQDWQWYVLENNGGKAPPEFFSDPRVFVMRATEDLVGVGALKRYLSMMVHTDFTVELDADDILREHALAAITEAFADADFVYSDVAEFRNQGEPVLPYDPIYGWESYLLFNGKSVLNANRQPPLTPQNLRYIMWSPNHVRAWRTSVYKELGGHEAGMLVADDHDLVVRFYLAGKRFFHIPEALYLYRIHDLNTVKTQNEAIQLGTDVIYDRYIWQLAEKFADDNGLDKYDLCCWKNRKPGYQGLDIKEYDELTQAADLNGLWPLDHNSVGVLKATDAIEHLRNPIHTMNEAYRVLVPGGFFMIDVPSTNGKGAFCDPTHVSYWNDLSFRYYTQERFAAYIPEFTGRFQVLRVKEYDNGGIPYVQAHLVAQKPGYHHMGTNGWPSGVDMPVLGN